MTRSFFQSQPDCAKRPETRRGNSAGCPTQADGKLVGSIGTPMCPKGAVVDGVRVPSVPWLAGFPATARTKSRLTLTYGPPEWVDFDLWASVTG
ncbi:hypothetical protein CBR_g19919 [Chara braunii]|uniref:Uncharacterized protein n=1 Tax=Chara braunii TaxID=69332 RepID=A0A388KZ02_CHABU|nr:hypothetical protein CBR_g19919 [Chara braunii]|eukprot:GBG75286.1 hypothetical protein CBR_g19919 [Chara braunii]